MAELVASRVCLLFDSMLSYEICIGRSFFEQLRNLPAKLPDLGFSKCSTRVYANRNSVKKYKRKKRAGENVRPVKEDDYISSNTGVLDLDDSGVSSSITIPSQNSVLQACTVTSGVIAALGVTIRQVSHVASLEGLPIIDCSKEVSFGFEMWHLELITGLVILISSCRYLLLKTWPDFAESSEAANQQVLSSLQPLDYLVVAFLPGFSEELLFRGALLPLFGINWMSALVVATIFGVLHLGSGRKYSFAVWATVVGFLYGYATILSSSVLVPMASHAANNLIGGILWRYSSNSSYEISNDDHIPDSL